MEWCMLGMDISCTKNYMTSCMITRKRLFYGCGVYIKKGRVEFLVMIWGMIVLYLCWWAVLYLSIDDLSTGDGSQEIIHRGCHVIMKPDWTLVDAVYRECHTPCLLKTTFVNLRMVTLHKTIFSSLLNSPYLSLDPLYWYFQRRKSEEFPTPRHICKGGQVRDVILIRLSLLEPQILWIAKEHLIFENVTQRIV